MHGPMNVTFKFDGRHHDVLRVYQ